MKRLHVHVAVEDLQKSIGFYSTLFAAEPTVVKPDYAKWMLDDPRVNFAISQGGELAGVYHLGIQAESDGELRELAGRLKAAGAEARDEEGITCCYARSNKTWVQDPSGVLWETFFTFGDATTYGECEAVTAEAHDAAAAQTACCGGAPASSQGSCC